MRKAIYGFGAGMLVTLLALYFGGGAIFGTGIDARSIIEALDRGEQTARSLAKLTDEHAITTAEHERELARITAEFEQYRNETARITKSIIEAAGTAETITRSIESIERTSDSALGSVTAARRAIESAIKGLQAAETQSVD